MASPSLLAAIPYLLFLLLLLPHTSPALSSNSWHRTIRVSREHGSNSPGCVNGTGEVACRNLSFALSPGSLLSNTTVYIDSDIPLSEPIVVFGNVSELAIRGNVDNDTAAPQVDCELGAGIAFESVDRVTVADISWNDCSVGFNASESLSEDTILRTALYFDGGSNVSICGCSFTSNRGSGVCMYNVVGLVHIADTDFINNTLFSPCGNNSTSCYSQSLGLQVLGTDIHHSLYTIEGCRFEGNRNTLSADSVRDEDILNYRRHRTVSHGGGVEVRLTGNSSHNVFRVENSKFIGNQALWGAGLEVGLGVSSEFNEVHVNRCDFVGNHALTGGGMRLTFFPSVNYDGYGTEDRHNSFTVYSCSFVENVAQTSGALSYFANRQLSRTNSTQIDIMNCNFTDNFANVSGAAIGLSAWNNEVGGYPTNANISNCTFHGNSISYHVDVTQAYGIAVVYTYGILLQITNSDFVSNFGSALVVSSTTVILAGEVLFDDNFGIYGGGLHLMGLSWITLTKGLNLTFHDNQAFLSGGAVFAASNIPQPTLDTRFCIIEYEDMSLKESDWNVSVSFSGNTAEVSGPSIFLSTPGGCFRENNTFPFSNTDIFHYPNSTAATQTSTPPQNITFGDPSRHINDLYTTQVMLGQPFQIHPLTVDIFNESTPGSAVLQLYQQCEINDTDCNDNASSYTLVGQDLVQLDNTPRLTSFHLTGPKSSDKQTYLLFFSDSLPSAVGFLHLNITPCHLGYTYSQTERKCKCILSDEIYCDVDRACVKYGYWIGLVNGMMTYINCPSGNCGYVNGRCPTSSCSDSFQSFCHLPDMDSDELCSGNRGGILCSNCRMGYTFSFGAVQCIPDHNCTPGDTVLLVFLNIVFWAALIAILLLVLKLHLRIGSGQLYCLIYYFGVLQYLTVNELPSVFLNAVVAMSTAFLELDPRFLGLIDKCFAPGLSNLGHLALRYMNPIFLALVVFAVVAVTRLWPRFSTVSKQNYSVRALCILLYLSFTSLSETSLQILSFIQFKDISGVYSKVDPTVRYFDPAEHLPYALVALFIELFFVLPFLFLILLAPWLAKVHWINLTRIKPIIDEYQGCYRDKCRWFAGYYLLWRQLVFIFSLINLGEFGGIFLLQQVSIVVLAIHAIFMPYKKTWLNVLDIILLSDLAIYSLFNGSTANVVLGNTQSFREAIIHILILIPMLYFLGICTLKLVVLLYNHYRKKDFSLSTVLERSKYHELEGSTVSNRGFRGGAMLREPLIFDSEESNSHMETSKASPSPELFSDGIHVSEEFEDKNSKSSAKEEAESRPRWYRRLPRGLTSWQGRQRTTPTEFRDSVDTEARDVHKFSNYTTSVVTMGTETS